MKNFKTYLEEGRPSQRHPLEGHEYHKKSDEALIHIAKDAHAAAEAMKGHNTQAENKYRDQANDSATVRHFRKTSGMPDWYKKKYGHVKEEIVSEAKTQKKADRYHINHADRPATLASYKDKESAIKDRDAFVEVKGPDGTYYKVRSAYGSPFGLYVITKNEKQEALFMLKYQGEAQLQRMFYANDWEQYSIVPEF